MFERTRTRRLSTLIRADDIEPKRTAPEPEPAAVEPEPFKVTLSPAGVPLSHYYLTGPDGSAYPQNGAPIRLDVPLPQVMGYVPGDTMTFGDLLAAVCTFSEGGTPDDATVKAWTSDDGTVTRLAVVPPPEVPAEPSQVDQRVRDGLQEAMNGPTYATGGYIAAKHTPPPPITDETDADAEDEAELLRRGLAGSFARRDRMTPRRR